MKGLALLPLLTGITGCHRLLPFGSMQADAPVHADARGKDRTAMGDYLRSLDLPARPDARADQQQSGLVAWYRLDDDAGKTGQALDSSGRGLHGSCALSAGGCPQQVPGRIGQAQRFDGISNAFQVPDSPGFHATRLTIALWISINVYDDGAPLSKPFGTGKLNSWQIETRSSDGQVSFTTTDGSKTTYLWTSTPVSIGSWVHLAATWDGQQKRIYIDGNLTQSFPGAIIPYDTHPLIIGADYDMGKLSYYFAGVIDDVRIYNRALSTIEIAALASP